jgi:hypothetical protein
VVGVLLGIEFFMSRVRAELDVVPSEIPLELKVVIDELFKDVFFHNSPYRALA